MYWNSGYDTSRMAAILRRAACLQQVLQIGRNLTAHHGYVHLPTAHRSTTPRCILHLQLDSHPLVLLLEALCGPPPAAPDSEENWKRSCSGGFPLLIWRNFVS